MKKFKLSTLFFSTFGFSFLSFIALFVFQQTTLLKQNFSEINSNSKSEIDLISENELISISDSLSAILSSNLTTLKVNTSLLAKLATDEYAAKLNKNFKPWVNAGLKENILGLRYSRDPLDESFFFASSKSKLSDSGARFMAATQKLSPLLAIMKNANPAYHLLYFTHTDHLVRMYPKADLSAIVPTNALSPSFDVNGFEFFRPATPPENPSGQFKWSDIYPAKLSKFLLVSAMQPIYFIDQFLGVATIDLRIDEILDFVANQVSKRNTEVLLLTDSGTLYGKRGTHTAALGFHGDTHSKVELNSISNPELAIAFEKLRSGRSVFIPNSFSGLFFASSKISGMSWKIVLVTDRRTFEAASNSLLRSLQALTKSTLNRQLTLTLVLFGLIFVVLLVLIRHLIKPIWKLRDAINQIGLGDYEIELPSQETLELQEIASATNRMAKQIRDAQEKLKLDASDTARGVLAHQVAHDLRSPLGALRLCVRDLSSSSIVKDSLGDELTLMRNAVERVSEIVSDLNKDARLNSLGHYSTAIEHRPLEIHAAIEEVIRLITKQASFHNVNIVRQYFPKSIFINIPKIDFFRIVTNLLNNAAEACSHRGQIRVTTSFTASSSHCEIIIGDNGCGIPTDVMHRIFERRFTFGKPGGTGEGLAIVKDLLSKHQGTAKVDSRPGMGTTFSLTFPVDSDDLGTESPLTNPESIDQIRLNSEQTLVIFEDDPVTQDHWRLLSQRAKINFEIYPNWNSFLDSHKQYTDPVFVIDFNLGNSSLNGMEISSLLKKQYPNGKFFICSAHLWDSEFRNTVINAQLPFIFKPISSSFQIIGG